MTDQASFGIGTRVAWTSSNTKKEGEITQVPPGEKVPADRGVQRLDNSGLPGDHEAYRRLLGRRPARDAAQLRGIADKVAIDRFQSERA